MNRRTATGTADVLPRIPPAPKPHANAADTGVWAITHRAKANFSPDCDGIPAVEIVANIERRGTDHDKPE